MLPEGKLNTMPAANPLVNNGVLPAPYTATTVAPSVGAADHSLMGFRAPHEKESTPDTAQVAKNLGG